MSRLSALPTFRVVPIVSIICLTGLALSTMAHETELTTPYPGFRPASDYAPEFLDALDTATIAVFPTIVRRSDRTAHSFESQAHIVAFLNESGIATAVTQARRIDLGPLRRPSQWEIFQYGAESIAAKLGGYETGADYTLVMELVLPEPHAVFGIEVYVLDYQGRNAFSFLLNSHHQMFVNAELVAGSSSEEARARMIEDATQVGMTALEQQINQARECAALAAVNTRRTGPGIFHDFETGLAARTDSHGVPLGFSTFSDGSSTAIVSTTTDHPLRPDEADGNHVMQLDMNVTGWAGVVKVFENDSFDTWISFDWSAFDAFSFWFYGNNSGTLLFVDVIDNRNPCSTVDDAERYAFEFVDDYSGWRQIVIPFADMFRKEIGNGAPNDGLGLSNVHGWGLGATKTNGPIAFYIDDFELRSASSE